MSALVFSKRYTLEFHLSELVEALAEVHVHNRENDRCDECWAVWPCETIGALAEDDALAAVADLHNMIEVAPDQYMCEYDATAWPCTTINAVHSHDAGFVLYE